MTIKVTGSRKREPASADAKIIIIIVMATTHHIITKQGEIFLPVTCPICWMWVSRFSKSAFLGECEGSYKPSSVPGKTWWLQSRKCAKIHWSHGWSESYNPFQWKYLGDFFFLVKCWSNLKPISFQLVTINFISSNQSFHWSNSIDLILVSYST